MRVPFWRGRSAIRRLPALSSGRWLSIRPSLTRTINWGTYTGQWAEHQTHRKNSPKFANCTRSPWMRIWRARCRTRHLRWIPHKKNRLADAKILRRPYKFCRCSSISFPFCTCRVHVQVHASARFTGSKTAVLAVIVDPSESSLVTVRAVAGERIPDARGRAGSTDRREGKHEHLDHIVRDFVDCMGGRVHGLPCSGRTDPPVADFCGDLTDHALRLGG